MSTSRCYSDRVCRNVVSVRAQKHNVDYCAHKAPAKTILLSRRRTRRNPSMNEKVALCASSNRLPSRRIATFCESGFESLSPDRFHSLNPMDSLKHLNQH
jgi:hypothetical protein